MPATYYQQVTALSVVSRISNLLIAIANCERSGNQEWKVNHKATLAEIMVGAPSGDGFDNGTTLSDDSTPERLVFATSFHHMNDVGMYDGWTEHTVTVRASLSGGLDVRVSGRNRNDIKECVADVFDFWLTLHTYPRG